MAEQDAVDETAVKPSAASAGDVPSAAGTGARPRGASVAPRRSSSGRRLVAPLVLLICLVGLGGALLMEPEPAVRQVSDVNPSAPKLPVHEIDARPRPSSPAATRTAGEPEGVPGDGLPRPTTGHAPSTTGDDDSSPRSGRGAAGVSSGLRVLAMRATVRSRAEQSAPGLCVLDAGERVATTGTIRHGWHQVLVDGRTGWVAGYALAPLRP